MSFPKRHLKGETNATDSRKGYYAGRSGIGSVAGISEGQLEAGAE
jgi:hypothetical protein